MQQIVEIHKAGQEETSRHINNAIFILVLSMVIVMATSAYVEQRIGTTIILPSPPDVHLAVATETVNPLLCPGDELPLLVMIQVDRAAVIERDTTVRSLDTGVTVLFSETFRIIYDEPGTIETPAVWMVPPVIAATAASPERQWTAGNYRMNVSLTGVEGEKRASVASVDFRIGADCTE